MEERLRLHPDWTDFAARLAVTLGDLPGDGASLVLAAEGEGSATEDLVGFATFGSGRLRVETVSRALLGLGPQGDRRLWELGWRPPARGGAPAGPSGYYLDCEAPADRVEAARIVAATLHEVCDVISPGALRYHSRGKDGAPLEHPGLGVPPAPEDHPSAGGPGQGSASTAFRDRVEESLREMLGVSEVRHDEDGDVAIRMNEGPIAYVRAIDDEYPFVHVFAPVLWGLQGNPSLLEAINDVNRSVWAGKVVWDDGSVMAVVDVPAFSVSKDSLTFACDMVGSITLQHARELRGRFGGATVFDGPSSGGGEEGGAGYL